MCKENKKIDEKRNSDKKMGVKKRFIKHDSFRKKNSVMFIIK